MKEILTKLNRIHKLSKLAKLECHEMNDNNLSEQGKEIATTRYYSMLNQMGQLINELNISNH